MEDGGRVWRECTRSRGRVLDASLSRYSDGKPGEDTKIGSSLLRGVHAARLNNRGYTDCQSRKKNRRDCVCVEKLLLAGEKQTKLSEDGID